MTLPDERYTALIRAKDFFESLLDPKITPRVPKSIRAEARSVLRHFPDNYHLVVLSEACPNVLEHTGDPIDPLYRIVKDYQLGKDKE